MGKILLLFFLIVHFSGYGQDSLTADYINLLVQKTENRMQYLVLDKKDTLIYEPLDTLKKGIPLSVRTEYYFNLYTNHMEKIVERTRYRTVVTELTVYYLLGQPIRFTSTQRDGSIIKIDFDVFYMNNNSVYFVKRKGANGQPDGDEFLKWCYDLLYSYRGGGS